MLCHFLGLTEHDSEDGEVVQVHNAVTREVTFGEFICVATRTRFAASEA